MDTLSLVGSALGLAVAAGLSLYGAVFVLGLAIAFDWVRLAPGWEPLAVLADPVILTVAGVLCAIEFLADKIPWVDSVWDAIHTAIRPVGGALLASRMFGELSPTAEIVVLLLFGGATLVTHSAKASVRLAVNMSPEPVSNLVVSLAENGLVAGAVWLALTHPLLTGVLALVAVVSAGALTVWLAGRVWRGLRLLRRRLQQRTDDRVPAGRGSST